MSALNVGSGLPNITKSAICQLDTKNQMNETGKETPRIGALSTLVF